MFASALLSIALLATTAFAAPPSRSARMESRLSRRREGAHFSRPNQRLESANLIGGNVTHVDYSSNWAGGVLSSASGTYKSVTGTFVVPTPKTPSGGSGSYSASAWVGIDGDSCETAILQTGVDFTIDSGSVSYDAWYEWYPDSAHDFSGIPIKAGDTIKVTVTATSTKAGSAVIENVTTGKTVSKSLSSSAALCEKDAEWIVEDFDEGGTQVPFANFGTVTFTGASATTGSGSVGPSGSDILDIKQSGTVLTSVSTGSSSVTISYV
ncbi:hypothetical protein FA95DRAFT_1612019 [Auriscalpium vulgare]|uniref:Uncharacterized protein n=1 Tax=Auriscalpium vulgare TaxID=40419 RepID=A0ACB8R7R5_9AGAM|nr:hypothetical protein FA95DRAFT_1612019 [Auriscalpium vulgare]